MFVTSIIYDCGIKKKQFWKDIIPKKHLCIILHMISDISFEITKPKDHMKDPPYTSLEFSSIVCHIIYCCLSFTFGNKNKSIL
jgi:hypothetical protein